ncbi:hypothetical protein GCM10020220_097850 [Nonomuraea rubra]
MRDLHVAATMRAAAPYQRERGRSGAGLVLRGDDLREVVREGREGNLVLFVVDASGSMAARKRMTAVKTAVLSLLLDAYQRRDKVGLVTFRGSGAEVALSADVVGGGGGGAAAYAGHRRAYAAGGGAGAGGRGVARRTAARSRAAAAARAGDRWAGHGGRFRGTGGVPAGRDGGGRRGL